MGNESFGRTVFLAAMSSSRSDVVTQFVCVSVFPCVFSSPFFLLVSLVSIVYLECYKASKSVKGTQ